MRGLPNFMRPDMAQKQYRGPIPPLCKTMLQPPCLGVQNWGGRSYGVESKIAGLDIRQLGFSKVRSKSDFAVDPNHFSTQFSEGPGRVMPDRRGGIVHPDEASHGLKPR